jgi:hypothetical protein
LYVGKNIKMPTTTSLRFERPSKGGHFLRNVVEVMTAPRGAVTRDNIVEG